ncbi:hypothetical protein [uncultured Anaeromusa sp.]|uniref:hypothetical protein n=1 Tax=uncultured Anaeromusa sp. TaxID=673273 RepID=UPI0029C68FEF|nr:hypothetical protein [uncultured Anaeromusa sp.]
MKSNGIVIIRRSKNQHIDNSISSKFYESARLELINRINLRNQLLSWYMAVVAAVAGFVFKDITNFVLLYVIAFFALGVSLIISQHNSIIGCIEKYCALELGPFIENEKVHQWDNSIAFKKYRKQGFIFVALGHSILINAPILVSIVYLWSQVGPVNELFVLFFILIAIFLIFYKGYADRK